MEADRKEEIIFNLIANILVNTYCPDLNSYSLEQNPAIFCSPRKSHELTYKLFNN